MTSLSLSRTPDLPYTLLGSEPIGGEFYFVLCSLHLLPSQMSCGHDPFFAKIPAFRRRSRDDVFSLNHIAHLRVDRLSSNHGKNPPGSGQYKRDCPCPEPALPCTMLDSGPVAGEFYLFLETMTNLPPLIATMVHSFGVIKESSETTLVVFSNAPNMIVLVIDLPKTSRRRCGRPYKAPPSLSALG